MFSSGHRTRSIGYVKGGMLTQMEMSIIVYMLRTDEEINIIERERKDY